MKVIVFGSINLDFITTVPHLPNRGETVIGDKFITAFGGKGANQAVAVAKLGIPVAMIGQVGGDNFGQSLLQGLREAGVNTDGVIANPDIHSGVASIVVDTEGENTIACAAGANSSINREDVQRFAKIVPQAQVAMFELGIPLDAILEAAKIAHHSNCITILDPAPARSDLKELYPLIDIITPNELEASQLVGFTVDNQDAAAQAAQFFLNQGVRNAIITLGGQGVFCGSQEESFYLPALEVPVVDTVAAGDAFNGGLASALASGKSLREALNWGRVAGALAVTKSGAQPSLPDQNSFFSVLYK